MSETIANSKFNSGLNNLRVIFMRTVALVFIVFALRYWLMIVGFYAEEGIRFDLMPLHWQIISSLMSVLMPIAALGLWGAHNWGLVMWLIAIFIELVIYVFYTDMFGSRPLVTNFHIFCVIVLFLLTFFPKLKKGTSN